MNDLKKYLPMATNVVEAFRQRFPKKDANGKIDMWPAQVRRQHIHFFVSHFILKRPRTFAKTGSGQTYMGKVEKRLTFLQALETYQCHDPTSRDKCPTNPSTDIGGLMAVLPRLIGATRQRNETKRNSAWLCDAVLFVENVRSFA